MKKQKSDDWIFEKAQSRPADVTQFFTYGTSLNFVCKISGISKDNYESSRLILTNGKDFEKEYSVNTSFENNSIIITTANLMNNSIKLEDLPVGEYVPMIRLKLNNSTNHRYYLLKNTSAKTNIEYNTLSKDRKVQIVEKQSQTDYAFMKVKVVEEALPENIYDIVIDAGHGGDDSGKTYEGVSEADITLDYAESLKTKLEEQGLKVKLTRDSSNTDLYKEKNTYSDGGRISVACESKAKYMISLHVNDGNRNFSGLEIYAPCKSDLSFAKNMANSIVEKTSMEYSNVGKYRVLDGVYVENFGQTEMETYENNAKRNGYDPYTITEDTPMLYTIREVGGIATNAFVDGRNKAYSANKFYNSNHGIECYQIELGYIKNDLEILQNEKEQYIQALADSIIEIKAK